LAVSPSSFRLPPTICFTFPLCISIHGRNFISCLLNLFRKNTSHNCRIFPRQSWDVSVSKRYPKAAAFLSSVHSIAYRISHVFHCVSYAVTNVSYAVSQLSGYCTIVFVVLTGIFFCRILCILSGFVTVFGGVFLICPG